MARSGGADPANNAGRCPVLDPRRSLGAGSNLGGGGSIRRVGRIPYRRAPCMGAIMVRASGGFRIAGKSGIPYLVDRIPISPDGNRHERAELSLSSSDPESRSMTSTGGRRGGTGERSLATGRGANLARLEVVREVQECIMRIIVHGQQAFGKECPGSAARSGRGHRRRVLRAGSRRQASRSDQAVRNGAGTARLPTPVLSPGRNRRADGIAAPGSLRHGLRHRVRARRGAERPDSRLHPVPPVAASAAPGAAAPSTGPSSGARRRPACPSSGRTTGSTRARS